MANSSAPEREIKREDFLFYRAQYRFLGPNLISQLIDRLNFTNSSPYLVSCDARVIKSIARFRP